MCVRTEVSKGWNGQCVMVVQQRLNGGLAIEALFGGTLAGDVMAKGPMASDFLVVDPLACDVIANSSLDRSSLTGNPLVDNYLADNDWEQVMLGDGLEPSQHCDSSTIVYGDHLGTQFKESLRVIKA